MIALAAALLAAPTLWLSVPAGAGCRVEEFVAAVVGRRPDLAVRAGSEPGAGDAAAAIDVEERGWRLTVKRAGMEPLHRSLPPPGADCVATSSTAALMIDRALEDLHWNGAAVRIEPMAREAAPGADERAPVPPAVPREPLPVEARIALGAGAATEFGSVLPALSLELGAQLGPWSIGAGATGSLAAHAAVGGVSTVGRYTAVPIDLQLIAGRRFSLGPGWLRLEFAPGLELALASATGATSCRCPPASRSCWSPRGACFPCPSRLTSRAIRAPSAPPILARGSRSTSRETFFKGAHRGRPFTPRGSTRT